LYYFVLFGLQPEPEPEAAAAVCYHYQCPHVRVGLCGMYMCAEPRHEAPSRLRPPQRSRVAGAKKYKYNTKYNTITYDTKYTPLSGVFSFHDT
jgi:hypothetical protein